MGEHLPCKFVTLGFCLFALIVPGAFAREPAQANGTALFKVHVSKPDRFRHALDRLTFGPRPGDLESISRMRLKRWVERQLPPERVSENPVLLERLQPFESLRLSIREAYLRYPPPQAIGAVARGRRELPDDPEVRALVARLAQR
jgi:hypothetical protein